MGRQQRWREEHRELARAQSRRYKKKNVAKIHESNRRYQLTRKYGITPEQYDTLLASQGGHCAICPATEPGGPRNRYFAVDHDHKTGKVRGLLCNRHNRGVGLFGDDPIMLRAAAAYLEMA